MLEGLRYLIDLQPMPLFRSDQCPRNFVPDGDNAVLDTLVHCTHFAAYPPQIETWYYTQVSIRIIFTVPSWFNNRSIFTKGEINKAIQEISITAHIKCRLSGIKNNCFCNLQFWKKKKVVKVNTKYIS